MTELELLFNHLGLTSYLQNFIDEGFDTWETVLYITESDLDALKVKLGHRRRLQSEIAKARGISFEQLVASHLPPPTNEENRPPKPDTKSETKRAVPKPSTAPPLSKRKYRRHPKPDDFAPERPPSAYVIFSNKIREDLRPLSLSFTEIAKRVGENWQTLSPEEREPYESQAATAKEHYNLELSKYKKTDDYRDHSNYLQEFKQRNSTAGSDGKRPRLETERSNASSASTGSLQQGEGSNTAHDVIRYDYGNTYSNSPPPPPPSSIQAFAAPFPGHGSPSSFRGGPSSSMQLPPFSQSMGSVPIPVTAGQQGSLANIESSSRGVGPFRAQAFPVMTVGETLEGLRATALPPIQTQPAISLPMSGSTPAPNTRRSMNTPASFLRKDTSTSHSTSSRSANFSSHGSHGSSAYSPITPSEEGKPMRTLPLSPILAAQSSSEPTGPSDRGSMYSSPPLSSMIPPQSMQPGQTPRLQAGYNSPSPSERTMMQDLSIETQSPHQWILRSHAGGLQEALPSSAPLLGSSHVARLPPTASNKRGREDSDSPPDESADPLSMLAYAGRIVGRDVQKPP